MISVSLLIFKVPFKLIRFWVIFDIFILLLQLTQFPIYIVHLFLQITQTLRTRIPVIIHLQYLLQLCLQRLNHSKTICAILFLLLFQLLQLNTLRFYQMVVFIVIFLLHLLFLNFTSLLLLYLQTHSKLQLL